MYGGKVTLYEILEVSRNAKLDEIRRAYQRFLASQKSETVPPDPRRAALAKEAWEILSDPDRREAYDRSLRQPQAIAARMVPRSGPRQLAAGAAVLVALVALAWFLTRSEPGAARRTLTQAELATAATGALARLSAIDVSGRTVPAGLAFAIGDGVLATSCRGIAPGAELNAHIVPRHVAVRVLDVDPRELCRLTAAGVGSWPLTLAENAPRRGEKVYAARVGASGEGSVVEGVLKSSATDASGTVYETTVPLGAQDRGGPLLDADGRAFAVASPVEGSDRLVFLSVPRPWTRPEAMRPQRPVAPVPAPAEVVKDAPPPGAGISEERKQRLQKAFRPPPKDPDEPPQ